MALTMGERKLRRHIKRMQLVGSILERTIIMRRIGNLKKLFYCKYFLLKKIIIINASY